MPNAAKDEISLVQLKLFVSVKQRPTFELILVKYLSYQSKFS